MDGDKPKSLFSAAHHAGQQAWQQLFSPLQQGWPGARWAGATSTTRKAKWAAAHAAPGLTPGAHVLESRAAAACVSLSPSSLWHPNRSGPGATHSPLASITATLPGPTTSTTGPWSDPTPNAPHPFASVTGASALSPAGAAAIAPAPGSAAAAAAAAAKAEVGRATWTLLHTLAAQFPDRPTRQQQRDARTLVDCLTRIYPCGDCARHFAELVRSDPPVVSSGPAFRRWLCQVHNRVNIRIGKAPFNCDLVESRWAPLGCSAEEAAAGEPPRSGCELLAPGAAGPGAVLGAGRWRK